METSDGGSRYSSNFGMVWWTEVGGHSNEAGGRSRVVVGTVNRKEEMWVNDKLCFSAFLTGGELSLLGLFIIVTLG